MRYHVVTTMNAAGWRQTGERMARAFLELWPAEALPLTVYAEDFDIDLPGVEVRRLPAWLDAFKRAHRAIPSHTGKRLGRYDYRFDAVKFAHKVAALTDFAAPLDQGVVVWLDADTFTHAAVTVDWLNGLFPGPGYIAWLDRLKSHPECGFVMFRAWHPHHARFMLDYRELYTSGALFELAETNDCFAMQHLIGLATRGGDIPPPNSLSGDRGWHHPFVNGPLGARLDHLKGPRKREGRSRAEDLKTARSEEYWSGAR